MSTSIPIRFISSTTSRPKSDSPPTAGASVAASAHGTFWLWVNVMYATPSRRRVRSTPSELSMLWPPSAPIRAAIRPSANTRRTSAAVRAIAKVSG